MSRLRNGLALAVVACMIGPLAGCQSGAPTPPRIAACDPTATGPTQASVGPRGVPGGLSLFGDYPDNEAVPIENRFVSNLKQHTFTTQGLDFDPDVYDADDLLVFASTRNSEHPDLFLKRIDGSALTQLTSDPADDIQPRFSPDGQRIVFCSNRGGNWDLWLVNRDGTGLVQLTHEPADEVAPCWSPDGAQLAYMSWGQRARQWEVWTLNVTLPGTRRFLAYGMFPAWSPDGQRLALQRARQRGSHLFSVWTVDLIDGEARQPTEVAHSDSAACIAPRWSPDGAMLVYCAVPEGPAADATASATPRAADLWVVELSSGLRVKLTDGSSPAFNPIWAADGRIFFVSPRAGTENVWSLTSELQEYVTADRPRAQRTDKPLNTALAKD